MKRSYAGALRILLTITAGCLLSFGSVDGWAQQKHKYFFKAPPGISKYTQQHTLDVGDVPGHQIRIGELHTKYTKEAPEYAGVKVIEAWARLTSDYVDASGRFMTYNVLLMENGDKIFSRGEGLTQNSVDADGSKKTSFSTVTNITGGTGKFTTIRGVLRGSGSTDFKSGTSNNVAEGEYWFEK